MQTLPATLNQLKNHRFCVLFIIIVALFFAGSLGNRWASDNWLEFIRTSVLYLLLFISVMSVAGTTLERRLLIASIVLLVLCQLLLIDVGGKTIQVANNALVLCFLLSCSAVVLRYLISATTVNSDTLFAALCGYAILIIVFASTYVLLDAIHPASFYIADGIKTGAVAGGTIATSSRAIYFSVVTITTLGYGDISPTHETARLFASFEAFVGQVYLAVLIARLVGLQLLNGNKA